MQRALFLDKDGTLVKDVPYNVDPARIQVYPEVPEVLAEIRRRGYKLLVVSNQAGIAQGYCDRSAVDAARDALFVMLEQKGVHIDGFYYCPHHPRGHVPRYSVPCECRKPLPGLLLQAAAEHGVDTATSWMVGDILNDVEAGKRAGCRTALVDRGNETEWVQGHLREPDVVMPDLAGLLDYVTELRPEHEKDSMT